MKSKWTRKGKGKDGWMVWTNGESKLQVFQTGPQELVSYFELPDEAREEFDYCLGDEFKEMSPRFAKDHLGNWTDTGDHIYTRHPLHGIQCDSPIRKWDGYASDSYFSGTLVKYLDDDRVIIGTYIS